LVFKVEVAFPEVFTSTCFNVADSLVLGDSVVAVDEVLGLGNPSDSVLAIWSFLGELLIWPEAFVTLED